MKHLKKYNELEEINEYFGGPLKDLMNPRIDQLISYLNDYKNKINQENSFVNKEETKKVENMYNYILNNMDLDTISSSNRQGDRITGSGEDFTQRVKRSVRNF